MNSFIAKIAFPLLATLIVTASLSGSVLAQGEASSNPNSSLFRINVCDGPTLPKVLKDKLPQGAEFTKQYGHPPPYIPCDFKAAMRQIQHFITIAITLGVLVAVVGFTYAGALYMTGIEKYMSRARSIFPKIFWGFIIMLSAWFIVYQLLVWLTGSGFESLLGK
jgi:hypothetical protein